MRILSMQCDGLREAANRLDEIGMSMGHDTTASAFIAHDISVRMREAADTITSLWNSLTASEAALNKAAGNWARCDAELRENQGTRYSELFGTPERAAQTLDAIKCGTGPCRECPIYGACFRVDYDGERTMLEWLRGEDEVIDEPDTIRNELMDSGLLRGDAE